MHAFFDRLRRQVPLHGVLNHISSILNHLFLDSAAQQRLSTVVGGPIVKPDNGRTDMGVVLLRQVERDQPDLVTRSETALVIMMASPLPALSMNACRVRPVVIYA